MLDRVVTLFALNYFPVIYFAFFAGQTSVYLAGKTTIYIAHVFIAQQHETIRRNVKNYYWIEKRD